MPLTSVLFETAYANFAMKRFGDASAALCEAKTSAYNSDGLIACGDLLGSQIHLVSGRYQEALLLGESVEGSFSRMRRTRFVGQSLVVQRKHCMPWDIAGGLREC